MTLSTAERSLIVRLRDRLASDTETFELHDSYYEGQQRIAAMGLSIPPEMRKLQTVVNWPRMYVDSIEHRMDVEGFRLAGKWRGDERLWNWWQYNNLDEESPLAHLEHLVHGRSYICVGHNDEDPEIPVITVESARNMIAETDPRTRRIRHALRVYTSPTDEARSAVVVYLPDETIYAEHRQGGWTETGRVRHELGVVPVVAMVNRSRIADRQGRTEMSDVMGLTDAACRTLTNLQGAQELMATPQRYILGANRDLFQDEDGNPIPTWQAYIANILAIPDEYGQDVRVGQFTSAELRNFTDTLNAYAHHVSAVTGLPHHYLGVHTSNPASAEAIRSSESRLVKHVERKNRSAGGAWEAAMRIGLRLIDGASDTDYTRLETMWRDPATPTVAEKGDAVQKLMGGRPLYDQETGLEEMGFSPERIEVVMQRSQDDPMMQLMRMAEPDEPSGVSSQETQPAATGNAGAATAP